MAIFHTDQSLEEMLEKMNNNQGVTETIHAGAAFINFKLQQRLLEEQREFNKQQLFWTKFLVYGTWGLVVATLLLVKFS